MADQLESRRRDHLDELYALREKSESNASTDCGYSEDAPAGLETLREAGSEVEIPAPGSYDPEGQTDGSDASHCPNCDEGVDAGGGFCRHCGGGLPEG